MSQRRLLFHRIGGTVLPPHQQGTHLTTTCAHAEPFKLSYFLPCIRLRREGMGRTQERIKKQVEYETEILKALILVAVATSWWKCQSPVGRSYTTQSGLDGDRILDCPRCPWWNMETGSCCTSTDCPHGGRWPITGYEWFTWFSVAVMAGSLTIVILKITSHK
jgi:hypothetical protein